MKKEITVEAVIAFAKEKRLSPSRMPSKKIKTAFKRKFDTQHLVINPFSNETYDNGIDMILLMAAGKEDKNKKIESIRYGISWAYSGAASQCHDNSIESIYDYKLRKFKEDHGGRGPRKNESIYY